MLDILEKYFGVSDIGEQYELEQWTDGGVDMIIYVNKNNIIGDLKNYLENFDIDEEIDIYRQDKSYKDNFTIAESLNDFTEWLKYINKIIGELEEL